MKQFLVLIAMIGLGVSLYDMIAGPGEDSVMQLLGHAWEREIQMRTVYP